ncbi:MAG: cobamide remodeling phosphodiesterase CbiR [Sphaerochaeta sp.]|jgi:sugar phosphate isomerase/epimerase|uniref:cobamide remodeling phosphodiesterase CbiR n=1 Tax=Sphaerochaeta sp. TaxID=1972642 RepID=UPI002FCB085C
MKNKLIRIGTTSYILPDDILPNIRYLAPLVDDVELVLFESEGMSNLPSKQTVQALQDIGREHALTYTIHFPLDIHPGVANTQARRHFVDVIDRIIDLSEPLSPFGYVLHLTPEQYGGQPAENVPRWLDSLDRSLDALFNRISVPSSLVCVESLSYPFALVQPLVARYNLSVTLDIGHIWLMGYDADAEACALLPQARICHLHGVAEGHDHLGLSEGNAEHIERFLAALEHQTACDRKQRVLTLEVFSPQAFESSTSFLGNRYGKMNKAQGGFDGKR